MLAKFSIALFLVAGCGSVDASADDAALTNATAPITGAWALASDGDISFLWLRSDGSFAWTRCYDADCATPVVESGTYVLTSSSGKQYVTFYQSGSADDADTHFNAMYAYTTSSSGLALRRVRTSTWMTFDAVRDEDLCSSSGGVAGDAGCACGAWPMAWSPGAGGCWRAPAVSERACDDTHGIWSDDDANAAGTFCDCGYGRVLTDSGCQAR